MAAISIATKHGKLNNIFKPFVYTVTGAQKAQFSHSRCINEHHSFIKNNELPTRCCVNAFSCSTDSLGIKSLPSNQVVDQRSFADSR